MKKDLLTIEEKKYLIKLYTHKLNSIDSIQEAEAQTVADFIEYTDIERLKLGDKLLKEEDVYDAVENIDQIITEVGDVRFKHRYDDRVYVEKRFAELASRLRRVPTLENMLSINITREKIRSTHGNINRLYKQALINHPTYFEYASEFKELINDVRRQWIVNTIKKHELFTFTSITSGPVSQKKLKTLLKFHEIEGGIPVIIPVCKRIEDIDQEVINLFLEKKCILVFEDLEINNNLKVLYSTQNEKTLNTLNGFQKEDPSKSIIFGGIVQRYKPLPVKKGGHHRAHFSTGTISANHHRASINHNKNAHDPRIRKAESNHFYGAILVEKISEKLFIPTQIMFDKDENFVLYGRRYTSKGVVRSKIEAYLYGDIHENEHKTELIDHSLNISEKLNIKKAVFHDLYDCVSGSHWNENQIIYKAYSYLKGETSWAKEIKNTRDFLNKASEVYDECHVVDSNHDDMLLRALNRGNVFKDPENSFFSMLLAPYAVVSYFEKESNLDPVKYINERLGIDSENLQKSYPLLSKKMAPLEMAVSIFGLKTPKKIDWMNLESVLNIGGYNCADHGHKSSNGSKGSGQSFSNQFIKMWFGHTHSAFQENHILGLGHNVDMTPGKRPHYSLGGTTTWGYADGMIFDNDCSHHVFTIDGHRSRFLSDDALRQYQNNSLKKVNSKFSYCMDNKENQRLKFA